MQIDQQAKVLQGRYLALDVLRGMTLAFMVIVNTPGSWNIMYSPLMHAEWHGFTPTDLVFPTFLFVVGNAMSFALKKMQDMKAGEFYKKVFTRAFLIFAIGWLLNAFPFFEPNDAGQLAFIDLGEVRLLGVLQRIALAYLAAALLLYWGGEKLGWIFSIAALIGYWPILYYLGTPGDPYSLQGNAPLKWDLAVIGAKRMYHGEIIDGEGIPFDPEGILSTLTSIVNVIAGYLVGKFVQRKGNSLVSVQTLALIGVVLIATSYAWDLVFPINKKIWTSPYVTLTVGWDLVLLSFLIFVVEIKNISSWTYFFQAFGRNPLILYVCSGVVISIISSIPIGDSNLKAVIYENAFTSWLSPKNASFFFSVAYMLLIWSIGFLMDKNKIYIRV
jgi:predicted acyltransferase